jgi:glycosyltransferase involved in cell wall biosynthesis
MRVLQIHNFYRSTAPSGEDEVVRSERELLRRGGVEVVTFERHNDSLADNVQARLGSAMSFVWSASARRELAQVLRLYRPDVAHFHNIFPQISVSAYSACRQARVPIVQTLHNFRLMCANGLLQRDGKPCELCVGKYPWPALRHRCYRASRTATAGIALSIASHRALRTHARHVSRFIALTPFGAKRFVAAGLPADRITIRGNCLDRDPGIGSGSGGYALYVGRLTAEKGVRTLVQAWESVGALPLKIVGDGELRADLEARARGLPIEFLGRMSATQVLEIMRAAALIIIPSECYEGFPRVLVEALATGTPVLASNLGGLGELVTQNEGDTFTAGDSTALAAGVRRLVASPDKLRQLRTACRARYDADFSADRGLRSILHVYEDAIRSPA